MSIWEQFYKSMLNAKLKRREHSRNINFSYIEIKRNSACINAINCKIDKTTTEPMIVML